MKHNLSRRVFLTSAAAFGTVAGTASANIFSDACAAVTGHAADAKSRIFSEDEILDAKIVKSGPFDVDAVGQDAAHWAKGTVEIKEHGNRLYIQLGMDFNSGPLPDGYVYFSSATDINDEADFNSSEQIEAGKLIRGKGASYYELSTKIKLSEVNSVTIWCKRFGAYIGSADLK